MSDQETPKRETRFIDKYTQKEGGEIFNWPTTRGNVVPDDNILEAKTAWGAFSVEINCVSPVHSFTTKCGHRWDCINGWTA